MNLEEEIKQAHKRGLSNLQIARRIRTSAFFVAQSLKRMGLETNRPWNRPVRSKA